MFRPIETDALLLIDIQVDFCPGGTLAVGEGNAVVPVANALSPRFDTVILTQDWHPPGHSSFASSHPGMAPFDTAAMAYGPQTLWPDHCVQGSAGAAFHPDLAVDRAQLVIRKGFRPAIDSYSAFRENDRKTATGLAGYLRDRGISRVFLAGLATDYCVTWSAEDAAANGFQAVVLLDACRAIDLDGSLLTALARMQGAGVQLAHSADVA
ncbi:MAG: hypothetical protein RLY86_4007 [Pseudomonadota bacterium]|jgi:nicotinamidase/pyrazinamidase